MQDISYKSYSDAFFLRMKMQKPDENLYYFDENAAKRPIKFVEKYTFHSKGKHAGKHFTLLDWQKEVISTIYGWKSTVDNRRKFRKVYIQIPRKNGKTLLASALAIYNLVVERADGLEEVVLAAGTRDQAKICLDNCKEFVRSSGALRDELRIYRNSVTTKSETGTMKVVSSEAGGVHGLNPTLVIADEVHTWSGHDLYDALSTAQGARSQPLFIIITTPGSDQTNICFSLYQYAKQVQEGVVSDEHFLPAIYEIPQGTAWDDPEGWKVANPSLGEAVTMEFLEAECRVAKAQPSYENSFKQLYAGLWVSGKSNWIDLSKWRECKEAIDWDRVEKLPCWVGIDLSSSSDTTAICVIYKESKTKSYLKEHIYVPSRSMDKLQQRTALPFNSWLEHGLIKKTDGDIINIAEIQHFLEEFLTKHNVKLVMYDPFGCNSLIPALQAQFKCLQFVQLYQGFNQLGPKTAAFERAIIEKTLAHGGSPVLDWQITNAATVQNGEGHYKITKKTSAGKIDAVVAAIMAYGAMDESLGDNSSSYDDPNNSFCIF